MRQEHPIDPARQVDPGERTDANGGVMGPSSLWGSLQRRLTFAVSVLILAILAAFSAIAYRTVESALNRVAEVRLDSAAGQLAALLGDIVGIEQGFLSALVRRPEIVAFLEN